MYWTSQIDKLLDDLRDWMQFDGFLQTSQVDIWLSGHRRCTDTHRPVLPANALHKLIPSLLREFLSQAVKEQTNWDAAHPRHCLSRKYPPLLCLRLPLSSFGPYVTPDWLSEWVTDWLLLRAALWWWRVMWDYRVSRPATLVTTSNTIKK